MTLKWLLLLLKGLPLPHPESRTAASLTSTCAEIGVTLTPLIHLQCMGPCSVGTSELPAEEPLVSVCTRLSWLFCLSSCIFTMSRDLD